MKLVKFLAAGLLAVSFAATASAQTKIYITGSTAFRAATNTAILGTLAGTVTTASDNSNLSKANAVTYSGGNIGGTAVTIKTSWSGSASGIQTVAGNTAAAFTVKFLPVGATGSANVDPRAQTNPALFEAARPDIAMADNLQTSTLFNGTFLGKTYVSLTDNTVGVVPFEFVASNGFPTGVSMNPGFTQYLYGGIGAAPLALLTGSTGDQHKIVYAGGRDPDSGTRINFAAESGVGVFGGVQQYQPTISTGHITALNLYAATTINGVPVAAGNSGESSGGSLAGFLNNVLDAGAYQTADGSATAGYLIAYLGISDANSALTAGTNPAVAMNWNGVPYTVAAAEQGQYTFWGYEHLDYRSDLGNGTTGGPVEKKNFANALVSTIQGETTAQLAPAGIALGDMAAVRTQEGTIVTANYF